MTKLPSKPPPSTYTGWHFISSGRLRGTSRPARLPVKGTTLRLRGGKIRACMRGFHASAHVIQAFWYKPYPSHIAMVQLSGDLDINYDKAAGRCRTYLTDYIPLTFALQAELIRECLIVMAFKHPNTNLAAKAEATDYFTQPGAIPHDYDDSGSRLSALFSWMGTKLGTRARMALVDSVFERVLLRTK